MAGRRRSRCRVSVSLFAKAHWFSYRDAGVVVGVGAGQARACPAPSVSPCDDVGTGSGGWKVKRSMSAPTVNPLTSISFWKPLLMLKASHAPCPQRSKVRRHQLSGSVAYRTTTCQLLASCAHVTPLTWSQMSSHHMFNSHARRPRPCV